MNKLLDRSMTCLRTWSFGWTQNGCDVNSWSRCYYATLSQSKLDYSEMKTLTITDGLVTPTQVA